MGRRYAGILGPLAFVTILARGIIGGATASSTLLLATGCLFAFSGIGFVIGQIADAVVLESVKTRFDSEVKPETGE